MSSRNKRRNRKNASVDKGQNIQQNMMPEKLHPVEPLQTQEPVRVVKDAGLPNVQTSVRLFLISTLAIVVVALAFIWGNSNDAKMQGGSNIGAGSIVDSSKSDVSKPIKNPNISKKLSDVDSSPVDSSALTTIKIDFDEPEHAEGIVVFTPTFKRVGNDLTSTYKGLDVYKDMYAFSVGVNGYTRQIKELVEGMGLIKKLEETTDNASYIVTQGCSDDNGICYQLYLGVDGSQEATISYNVSKGQMANNADTVWTTFSSLLNSYLGVELSSADLSILSDYLRTRVVDGGSFTLLANDKEAQVNVQVTVSAYGTDDEQWNCLGVSLIQGSQVQPDSGLDTSGGSTSAEPQE